MAKQPRILVGQVAPVTGAARGIGKATAQAFAREGMKVAIGDLDADLAEQAAAEIGADAAGFALDVTKPRLLRGLRRRRRGALRPARRAGQQRRHHAARAASSTRTRPTAARKIDINLHGVIHGMKIALPRMMARNRGHVVNIASQAGKYGAPGGATYSATKHAVIGLTEAVRGELHIEGSPSSSATSCPTS